MLDPEVEKRLLAQAVMMAGAVLPVGELFELLILRFYADQWSAAEQKYQGVSRPCGFSAETAKLLALYERCRDLSESFRVVSERIEDDGETPEIRIEWGAAFRGENYGSAVHVLRPTERVCLSLLGQLLVQAHMTLEKLHERAASSGA
jgi:hypothetical protein